MVNSFSSYYPSNWPSVPFHDGEVNVQKQIGVHDLVMSYAPKVIRPYMPDQHRHFYTAQPFLVVAARDARGMMWSTLLFGPEADTSNTNDAAAAGVIPPVGFVTSPHPNRLSIQAQPLSGDALEGSLLPGSDLGILGIEFATRRRNRVNGRLDTTNKSSRTNSLLSLEFVVDQSFGNCPQYIKPREWWAPHDKKNKKINHKSSNPGRDGDRSVDSEICPSRPRQLSKDQIAYIEMAESVFVATGYSSRKRSPGVVLIL